MRPGSRQAVKYKRYVAHYRPELRWRQNYVDIAFVHAYMDAYFKALDDGGTIPIKGYGSWYVKLGNID